MGDRSWWVGSSGGGTLTVCFWVLLFPQEGRKPGEHLKVRTVMEVPEVERERLEFTGVDCTTSV